jgi:phosphoserine phosphatase
MNLPSDRHRCRLAVFDLDGTLKAVASPYSHVHRALGVEAAAHEIYARYRRGELTYDQWGQEEIGLWRGLALADLRAILGTIPYWPGAVRFVGRLRKAGVAVAVVSAGFDVHVQTCAAELGADLAVYNRLGVQDGRLSGAFFTQVDGRNKGALVREIQAQFRTTRQETLVAGDTVYDVPMFPEAAVSLAVATAEPTVAQAADLHLSDGNWDRAWNLIADFRPGWLPD